MKTAKIFLIISILVIFAFPFDASAIRATNNINTDIEIYADISATNIGCFKDAVEQSGICISAVVTPTEIDCTNDGSQVLGICIEGKISTLVQDKNNCLDASGNPVPGAFCSAPFCCPEGLEGACVFKCNSEGQCENQVNQIVQVARNKGCMNCKEVKTGSLALPAPNGQEYVYFSGTSNKGGNPVSYTLVGQNTCEANNMTPFVKNSVNAPAPPVACSPFPFTNSATPDTTTTEWKTYTKCATLAKSSGLVFSDSTCDPGLAAFLSIGGGSLRDFPNENCQNPNSLFPDSKSCFCALRDYGCRRIVKAKDCFCSVYIPGYGDECSVGNPNCGGCPYDPDCDAGTPWPEQCFPLLPSQGGVPNSNGDGGFHDPNYPGSQAGIVTPPASDGSTVPPKTCAQSGGAVCETPSQCSGYIIPASDTQYCCGSDGVCTAKHFECNDKQQCVEVSGTGDNTCSTDSDCAEENPEKPSVSNMKVSQECSSSGNSSANFTWDYNGGSDQTKFDFQVDNNPDFSSPEVDRTQDSTSTTDRQQVNVDDSASSDVLKSDTTYYWRVKVYDSDGNDSGWYYGGTMSDKEVTSEAGTTSSSGATMAIEIPQCSGDSDKCGVFEFECVTTSGKTFVNGYFQLCADGCSDGACIGNSDFVPPQSIPITSCTDSDRGRNFFVKGTTSGQSWVDSNELIVRNDFCADSADSTSGQCSGDDCATKEAPGEPFTTLADSDCSGIGGMCFGSNCECVGPNCVCIGDDCPVVNPNPYCVGLDCDPVDDDYVCSGSDCEPIGPPNYCQGDECPCIGSNCHCEDSNYDCVCIGEDCPRPGPGYACVGPNCDPVGPNYACSGSGCIHQPAPPAATNIQLYQNYCSYGYEIGLVSFEWTYIGGNNETGFDFQVDDDSDFSSPEISKSFAGLSKPSKSINTQTIRVVNSENSCADNDCINYNETYYYRVKVYDVNGNKSDWYYGKSFKTANHAYPSPDFSLSPSTATITNGIALVRFIDSSIFIGEDATYNWDFGDRTPISHVKGDTYHNYTKSGKYSPTLQVCDSYNYCCSAVKNVTVKNPLNLPDWKETSPF